MRVCVLGTPRATDGDVAIVGPALGGRRAQVALVAMALRPGMVPAELLAELIWGEERPPTWQVALRGVVAGLRSVLAPLAEGRPTIVTAGRGYGLSEQVGVDLAEFSAALEAAEADLREGRYRVCVAAALPVAGLSGETLLPGEDGAWLAPHRARVDALAQRATRLIVAAAGRAGDHDRAVAHARRWVAVSPLDETAHRALIQSLADAGDRSAALVAYRACQDLLSDELGIDPSPETSQLYVSLLGEPAAPSPARLPTHTSSFVGREHELAALRRLLSEPGVVTVTGAGGVGKSRLVAEAAARVSAFPGGRLWVPVTQAAADELVPGTVALRLGIHTGGDDPAAGIAAKLVLAGRTLLVVDGCELTVDGAATFVSALVPACPELTVVATSRTPLGVAGERVLELTGLASPEPATTDPDLVRLLSDRVREAGGELVLGSETAADVDALLARCRGLPLAVELIAAQLVSISPGDLLDQLDEAGGVDGDPLRSIAQSSLASLMPEEVAVFRRLAVLEGHLRLDLIRAVVATPPVAPVRVTRILRELTASGLVAVDREGSRWRYRLDDDLHRFAGELLRDSGESMTTHGLLAQRVLSLLPSDARASPAEYQASVTEVLDCVRAVLMAALDGRADADRCLELAFRLHRYWAATSVSEGRFWLSRLLAVSPGTSWRPYATYALGYLDYWSGHITEATVELQSAADQFAGTSDPYLARALIFLAGLLDDQDRGEEAVACVRRAMAAAEPHGVDLQVSAAMGLGSVLSERGSPEAADHAVHAIALCREGGSLEQLTVALPTATMVCWQVGALSQARTFLAEALPLHSGTRRIARVVLLSAAAGLALADGDLDEAIAHGTVADREGTELGIEREMPLIRAVLTRALLAAGRIDEAADRAVACLQAGLEVSVDYPLAVGLETAALVLAAGGVPRPDLPVSRFLAEAALIRHRGSRPAPATLAPAVLELRGALPAARASDVRAAAELAITRLTVHTDHDRGPA